MLERTDVLMNEVLEPITFVLAYQLYKNTRRREVVSCFYNHNYITENCYTNLVVYGVKIVTTGY